MNKIKGLIEGFTISVLAIAFSLGLLEAGAWLYVRHEASSNDQTLEKLDSQRMDLYRKMFPDLSDTEISGLFFTYKQIYEPWVEFRNENLDYPLVHATGLLRKTVPDVSSARNKPLDVYFFGGSTMQGVHVPDNRTLPSQFVDVAAGFPELPVRAFNYGQPYYYLKQETMLFFNLLLDGKRPDVAIFLDGLNDFHQPGSSWSRAPFFTPAMRWMFEQPYTRGIGDLLSHTNLSRVITRSFGERKLSDAVPAAVINGNYSLPGGVRREEAFRTIAESYANDVTSTLRLCNANGVTCLFFLQPVPFVNYDRSRENISMRGDQPEYKTGYEQIKAKLRAVENFHSLDDAFVAPPELPYVDAVHYSPYGNHALADLIYRELRAQLRRGHEGPRRVNPIDR